MAQIELKTRGVKGACIICNCMPMDETRETRTPLPMFHAVGVDVNWGEDCNICQVCAGVMADMMGRGKPGDEAKLKERVDEVEDELEELEEKFKDYKLKVKDVLNGKKAQKELVSK